MRIFLLIGSNLGDKRQNLTSAIEALIKGEFDVEKISPLVYSPAILPEWASNAWNHPFLNVVVAGRFTQSPQQLWDLCKSIQNSDHRPRQSKWAPRELDIDMLLWGDSIIDSPTVKVPHPDIASRAYVLTPLAHLAPSLPIPGTSKTVIELKRDLKFSIPLLMGILNVTPDSFSDGGRYQEATTITAAIDSMTEHGAHVIDIGAESTRPGATAISESLEWQRLEPALKTAISRLDQFKLRPLISVDTRHAVNAERAIDIGVDIINDVGGLKSAAMRQLAKRVSQPIICMHSLDLPVNPQQRLPDDVPLIDTMRHWMTDRCRHWQDMGLDLDRLILDPGIGFGKDQLQSLALMREAKSLSIQNVRLLIGHSRKRLLASIANLPPTELDIETLSTSIHLFDSNVDLIRVHNIPIHARGYLAWAHMKTKPLRGIPSNH